MGVAAKNTMRLNFSNATPELLEEAIRRLGRALEKRLSLVTST